MSKVILQSEDDVLKELDKFKVIEPRSRGILEFILPDDREEFVQAVMVHHYYDALYEISQQIFRPHRKHGYNAQHTKEYEKLNMLNEKSDDVTTVIGILEDMFYKILNEHQIEL